MVKWPLANHRLEFNVPWLPENWLEFEKVFSPLHQGNAILDNGKRLSSRKRSTSDDAEKTDGENPTFPPASEDEF